MASSAPRIGSAIIHNDCIKNRADQSARMIFHACKTRSLPLFPDTSNNGTQHIITIPIIRTKLTIHPTHVSVCLADRGQCYKLKIQTESLDVFHALGSRLGKFQPLPQDTGIRPPMSRIVLHHDRGNLALQFRAVPKLSGWRASRGS